MSKRGGGGGFVGAAQAPQAKRARRGGGAAAVHAALGAGRAPEVDVVLLDIEGTTTPISFVHERLFPFAAEAVEAYLAEGWARPEVQEDARALAAEMGLPEASAGGALPAGLVPRLAAEVRLQIAENRKTRPLKQLQGRVWRSGYAAGTLVAELYDDVAPCLRSWHRRGYRLAVYSSGSVEAQKLLFAHTPAGDLLGLFSDHYDTGVGHKRETPSYARIARELGAADDPSRVLFVTDVLDEAVAADEAGMRVALSVRPGNAPLPDGHGFPVVESLVDLRL